MLLNKLCEPANNVGSAVLDRCERGDVGRRIQSGRRKKQEKLQLDPTSPFYVNPRRLPTRTKPAPTRQHSVKTEIADVEERLQTITNRISLLKSESDRLDRQTREINDRAEHVRDRNRRAAADEQQRRPQRQVSDGGIRDVDGQSRPVRDSGVGGGRSDANRDGPTRSGRSLTVTKRKVMSLHRLLSLSLSCCHSPTQSSLSEGSVHVSTRRRCVHQSLTHVAVIVLLSQYHCRQHTIQRAAVAAKRTFEVLAQSWNSVVMMDSTRRSTRRLSGSHHYNLNKNELMRSPRPYI